MSLKNLRPSTGTGSTTAKVIPAQPGKAAAAAAPATQALSHLVPRQDKQFKVYFAPEDSNQIDAIRRAISPFVRLASYAEVMEWICFQCKEHPELVKDFHQNYAVALGSNVYSSGLKASCLTDSRILDWICEVTNEKAYKGPTFLLRWMIERWDVITNVTGWKALQVHPEMDPGGDGGFRARASRR